MPDSTSVAASSIGATGLDLAAASRAEVALPVVAIVIILQNGISYRVTC